jgi:ribosomal protein S18 acetylase RimI-like enzyme
MANMDRDLKGRRAAGGGDGLRGTEIRLRSLSECSIADITALWNKGFEQYVNDMSRTEFQMAVRMGKLHIHPEMSVAAYAGDTPAGFVMIGWRDVGGRKLAWNGGTGVAVAFRGCGLSKLLLAEAIRRAKTSGAERLSLEARTDNDRAVAAYRSQGFVVADRLLDLRRTGGFSEMPFRREKEGGYSSVRGTPELAGGLSFYNSRLSSWTTELFSLDGGRSLIVYDSKGTAAGYSLYQEEFDSANRLSSIRLCHCEADPGRGDGRDVIRYMLAEIMKPCVERLSRKAHYVRASNRELMEALREAGFEQTQEEYLMELAFS